MVPISVTGVHNCLSNCFITCEEAWAPSALSTTSGFWEVLSRVLTCICLLPDFPGASRYLRAVSDSNAFNGNSHGWLRWWGGEQLWQFVNLKNWHVLLRTNGKGFNKVHANYISENCVQRTRFALALLSGFFLYILSQSLRLKDPWDSSHGACCPNESSFSNVGRRSGGDWFYKTHQKPPKMPSVVSSTSSKTELGAVAFLRVLACNV